MGCVPIIYLPAHIVDRAAPLHLHTMGRAATFCKQTHRKPHTHQPHPRCLSLQPLEFLLISIETVRMHAHLEAPYPSTLSQFLASAATSAVAVLTFKRVLAGLGQAAEQSSIPQSIYDYFTYTHRLLLKRSILPGTFMLPSILIHAHRCAAAGLAREPTVGHDPDLF